MFSSLPDAAAGTIVKIRLPVSVRGALITFPVPVVERLPASERAAVPLTSAEAVADVGAPIRFSPATVVAPFTVNGEPRLTVTTLPALIALATAAITVPWLIRVGPV